jgi:hypothetical protein
VTVLVVCAGSAVYVSVALLVMRRLYGRWRAKAIDGETDWSLERAVAWFDNHNRSDTMLGAFLCGLVWFVSVPVIVASLWLKAWMESTPVRATKEFEAMYRVQKHIAEHRERRIAELEKELKVGEGRNDDDK